MSITIRGNSEFWLYLRRKKISWGRRWKWSQTNLRICILRTLVSQIQQIKTICYKAIPHSKFSAWMNFSEASKSNETSHTFSTLLQLETRKDESCNLFWSWYLITCIQFAKDSSRACLKSLEPFGTTPGVKPSCTFRISKLTYKVVTLSDHTQVQTAFFKSWILILGNFRL